jgi:hypothetical protein
MAHFDENKKQNNIQLLVYRIHQIDRDLFMFPCLLKLFVKDLKIISIERKQRGNKSHIR